MSLKALIWAKDQRGLASLEKLLLIVIADYYNDEQKRAWPGRKELSLSTGMSIRTISKHVGGLEGSGHLLVERWFNNDSGKNLSNRYYLPLFDPDSGRRCKSDKTVVANVHHDPKTGRISFTDDT